MIGTNDLYFKRQKRARGEFPDVYQYEELPEKLKVQIIHIWRDSLGEDCAPNNPFGGNSTNRTYYEIIYKILTKELGLLKLWPHKPIHNPKNSLLFEIEKFFLNEQDIEICLSVVELMLNYTQKYYIGLYRSQTKFSQTINELTSQNKTSEIINELNTRFKEHGVGYQYENNQIIRIDSQYIHSEAVKPTLILLNQPMYQGAQQEFLQAHEHYRHQRYQEAIMECLKAYESTLKIILKKRGWDYKDTDTADALTGKVLQHGLVPEYWLQYFKSLKNTLTAGVPTARNKDAGHGQGDELREIPDYLASYVLHMTASAILFLIRAEENLPA